MREVVFLVICTCGGDATIRRRRKLRKYRGKMVKQ